MIRTYDLGENIVDQCQSISIDELVKRVSRINKENYILQEVESFGQKIRLTTSKTYFNGERLWFLCPICNRRINKLYKHPQQSLIGCRICLKLKYRNQRYRGMIEDSVDKVLQNNI